VLLAGLAGLELALEAELLEPSDEEAPALLLLEADSLELEPALASPAEPPAAASAPATGTAASLVFAPPLPLLRKSVTYQPEPFN
jgi:hypothetical protein